MRKPCFFIPYALVAQLDRVTGYEPVGQGFESLLAHQLKTALHKALRFFAFYYIIFQVRYCYLFVTY